MNPKSHNLPYREKFQPYARFLKEQNLFAKFTNNATILSMESSNEDLTNLKEYLECIGQKDFALTLIEWDLANDPYPEYRTLVDKWVAFASQCPFTKYDDEKEEWHSTCPHKYKQFEENEIY